MDDSVIEVSEMSEIAAWAKMPWRAGLNCGSKIEYDKKILSTMQICTLYPTSLPSWFSRIAAS